MGNKPPRREEKTERTITAHYRRPRREDSSSCSMRREESPRSMRRADSPCSMREEEEKEKEPSAQLKPAGEKFPGVVDLAGDDDRKQKRMQELKARLLEFTDFPEDLVRIVINYAKIADMYTILDDALQWVVNRTSDQEDVARNSVRGKRTREVGLTTYFINDQKLYGRKSTNEYRKLPRYTINWEATKNCKLCGAEGYFVISGNHEKNTKERGACNRRGVRKFFEAGAYDFACKVERIGLLDLGNFGGELYAELPGYPVNNVTESGKLIVLPHGNVAPVALPKNFWQREELVPEEDSDSDSDDDDDDDNDESGEGKEE